MRRRRTLTALLALVLAVFGAVLLTRYVQGADARALAGTTVTDVVVVTRFVSAGTTADQLAARVETRSLPAVAVVPGALTTLSEAGDRVVGVDLQPGEQLLDSKLVDSLTDDGTVTVPAGDQLVSVSLDRQRMLGDGLAAGDTVGVVVSLDAGDEDEPATTGFAVQKVLVTQVGEGTAATQGGASADDEDTPDADAVLVTLAASEADVQKIIFGAEHGRLWLTRQPADVQPAEISAQTRERLYR